MTVIQKKKNSGKAIVMPISGSMCRKHSAKLEWALREFITSNEGDYYDDELDEKGVLTSYFRLKNNICVEQRIIISDVDYVCYTTLSVNFNPKNIELYKRICAFTNAINVTMKYGNFEVDITTGDIRFRTYYAPDNKVCSKSLHRMLGTPLDVINKFGDMFVEMIKHQKVSEVKI